MAWSTDAPYFGDVTHHEMYGLQFLHIITKHRQLNSRYENVKEWLVWVYVSMVIINADYDWMTRHSLQKTYGWYMEYFVWLIFMTWDSFPYYWPLQRNSIGRQWIHLEKGHLGCGLWCCFLGSFDNLFNSQVASNWRQKPQWSRDVTLMYTHTQSSFNSIY